MRYATILAFFVFLSCQSDRSPTSHPSPKVSGGIFGAFENFSPADTTSASQSEDDTTSVAQAEGDTTSSDSLSVLPDSLAFNIELVFLEEYPAWEVGHIHEVVKHWEKQLMDVPSYTVPHDMQLSTCRHDSPDAFLKKGEVIDDIRVYVSLGPRDEYDSLGGVLVERASGIPAVGCIDLILPRWGIESGMWDNTQNMGQLEGDWHQYETAHLTLHELSHALGIGTGTLWEERIRQGEDYKYFDGSAARLAYDALPRLVRVDYHPDNVDEVGNISLNLYGYDEAVTAQPGGILYQGDKVPLNVWYDKRGNAYYDAGHWGPTMELELMGNGFVRVPLLPRTFNYKLSSVTVGALEDLGYPTRLGMADPFWVMVDEQGRQWIDRQTGQPIPYAAKPVTGTGWRCGVGRR